MQNNLFKNIILLILFCLFISIFSILKNLITFDWNSIYSILKGEGSYQTNLIIINWRLPRVIMAILIGSSLGVSGAIFQSLMQNHLASPDILGFNNGAYSGVLISLIFFEYNINYITYFALFGGIVASTLVYFLSLNNGIDNLRLIIIGISVKIMFMALNSWLIINTSIDVSLSASLWNAGSLSGITWQKFYPFVIFLLISFTSVFVLSKRMFLLEIVGNDIAYSIGIPVQRTRLYLILISVILTSLATSLVGPISFIALLAPQIARNLSNKCRIVSISGIILVALCGGSLLVISDAIAQYLFVPYQLPVGVITITLGGLYLMILLLRSRLHL